MAGKVAELQKEFTRDNLAAEVSQMWDQFNQDRREWLDEHKELRAFLFSTDTTKTSVGSLPWKNKTRLPKITQIRDNLHANYLSALLPNDNWLRWEAYSEDSIDKTKRSAIQAYMSNKVRESNMRTVLSQLLMDYIDYGNAFADVEFVKEQIMTEDGPIDGYVGPKLCRISPLDIVFNPLAPTFKESPKIVRSIVTIGELKNELGRLADKEHYENILAHTDKLRNMAGNFTHEDFEKAFGFTVDGFQTYHTYLQSGYVEILELEGDIYIKSTGELLKNHVVTVVDRMFVARAKPLPDWFGSGYKVHVGWRGRPDNLWAQGPLDNLVGMQYRVDHLENLKADVFDLIAFPPLKITGDVEEFEWGPLERIHVDEGGNVEMLVPQTAALAADNQINFYMAQMEEFAGAPKESMGIRTPGEKTAFEVQTLQNAAGRIFQEKITNFEINLLEPILNFMLESARRNMQTKDVVRIMDDDLGVVDFITIEKEDITAKGKLRPIGARHFAAQAQVVQNLTGLASSGIWADVRQHVSKKALAKVVEDLLQFERFGLVREFAGLEEDVDAQRFINQATEDLQVEAGTDTEV